MAVLEIDSWQTYCSACRKSTDWTPTHEVVRGYGPENGSPGCGEEFTAVTFRTFWPNMEADPRADNPRYPDWMKELPLV